MAKCTLLCAVSCLFTYSLSLGQMRVGLPMAPPDGSATLDISSGPYATGNQYRGMAPPKVALVQASQSLPISKPTVGLLVYNTATTNELSPGYYYWGGSQWLRFATASPGSARVAAVSGQSIPAYLISQVAALSTPDIIYIADEGREGLFRYLPNSAATVDGAIVLQAGNGRYKRIFTGPISIKWFGAKGDGIVSDTQAFTAAIATAMAQPNKATIALESSQTYRLDQGISIDVAKIKMTGSGGAVLNFQNMSSGNAITLTSTASTNPSYTQTTTGLEDIEIVGPGKSVTAVKGIVFSASAGANNSHCSLQRLAVHGFSVAVENDVNSYLPNFWGGSYYYNGTAFKILAKTNSGEGINLFGTRIFNNDLAIDMQNPEADLYLTAGSLDYNTKHINITGGIVNLINVHIEGKGSAYSNAPIPFTISGNGATLRQVGGSMIGQDNSTIPEVYYSVNTNPNKGGGVWLTGVNISNCLTSSGYLANGNGDFHIRETAGYEITQSATMTSKRMNKCLDGSFERDVVTDNFLVTGTAQRTDRLIAQNSELSISSGTTTARSGSKSLQHKKAFGGGSDSGFQLLVPIHAGMLTSAELYLKAPGTSTGTLYVVFEFAGGVTQNSGTYPVVSQVTNYGDNPSVASVDIGSQARSWYKVNLGQPVQRAPSWATHLLISVNAFSWNSNGDSIYYDDITVTQQ